MSDKKGTDKSSKKGASTRRQMTREEFEGHLNELIEAFGEAEIEETGNGINIRYPKERCVAKTMKGKRCANTAKHGTLCSVHHRMKEAEEATEMRKRIASDKAFYEDDNFIDSDVEMDDDDDEEDDVGYTPTYARPPTKDTKDTKKPSGKR